MLEKRVLRGKIAMRGDDQTVSRSVARVDERTRRALVSYLRGEHRFDLTLANGQLTPGDELGLIEITTQWYHNPDVDIRRVKTGPKGFLSAFAAGESDTEVRRGRRA